ncbi:MAG: hypothetical protein ACWGO1_00040 [Anaerolineales bacterium]
MKKRKSGKRHRLLLYRRTMDRLWVPTLVLGIVLGAIWLWTWFSETPIVESENEIWLLAGAAVAISFSVFAFLARRAAYVQPRHDHLRLVTPFLRLNISYRRIRSVHPAAFQQLFPPGKAGWSQRRFLEPFYGRTAVVVELVSFPMSPVLLRLFLSPQMFSPQSTGFVFVVPDWMPFSTEVDTYRSAWMQAQKRRQSKARRGW